MLCTVYFHTGIDKKVIEAMLVYRGHTTKSQLPVACADFLQAYVQLYKSDMVDPTANIQ